MPIFVGIAAAAAASMAGSAVVSAVGLAGTLAGAVVGAAVGAVVGATVGAIGTAIIGGDIGQGALYGAIGGAVAGGFSGYFAGGEGAINAEVEAGTGFESVPESTNLGAVKGGSESTGFLDNVVNGATESIKDGSLISDLGTSAVSATGEYLSGQAEQDALAEQQEKQREADEKARQDEFENTMQILQEKHGQSLEAIRQQGKNSLAVAGSNNAGALKRLNTQIQADKDTIGSEREHQQKLKNDFNNSVKGTDISKFERPKLQFDNEAESNIAGYEQQFNNGQSEGDQANPGLGLLEQQRKKQAVA